MHKNSILSIQNHTNRSAAAVFPRRFPFPQCSLCLRRQQKCFLLPAKGNCAVSRNASCCRRMSIAPSAKREKSVSPPASGAFRFWCSWCRGEGPVRRSRQACCRTSRKSLPGSNLPPFPASNKGFVGVEQLPPGAKQALCAPGTPKKKLPGANQPFIAPGGSGGG